MTNLKTAALLVLCSVLPACGDQLVQFPGGPGGGGDDDGGGDAGGNPASRPTVISTGPANAATEVSINKRIVATFDRAMNPATITSASFTVRQGATAIPGDVTYVNGTALFLPRSLLDLALEYTGTITTLAADLDGNTLASNYVWKFTTGACSLAPVILSSAGDFAVLAGSTVTNIGLTSVTGDLGVSPGMSVTGFAPPGILNGTQHAGDAVAAQAILDLTTAYNDAAGRSLCPMSVAGNLGGQTLPPGLYKSTSALEISSGDLTLDARGDSDAVFIFSMASTLTTAAGRQVILSGGAQAANVYWQVGSSASLGTSTAFHGTIMADQAIALSTSATLAGRALARIAVVALDSNTIVLAR